MNAIYRNDILASDSSLIGEKITIEINPDDLRRVKAYTETGCPIGDLYAIGGYGKTKHTLKTRKAAAKLARENGRNRNVFADPVNEYQEHLRENSKGNRRNATKADQVRREAGKQEFSKEEGSPSAQIIPIAKDNLDLESLVMEVVNGETVVRPMTMDEYIAKFNAG